MPADEVGTGPIDVVLRVSSTSQGVMAEVTFVNREATRVALYSINACAGNQIENDMFRIVDEVGNEVPYTGILAKRRRPRPEDFISLEAGGCHRVEVNLGGVYDFGSAARGFRAKYSALNPYPDRVGHFLLESREVLFRLDGERPNRMGQERSG